MSECCTILCSILTISETIWRNLYNKLKLLQFPAQRNTICTWTFSWKCHCRFPENRHCTVIVQWNIHIAPKIERVTISEELFFSVLICIVLNFKNNIEEFPAILDNDQNVFQNMPKLFGNVGFVWMQFECWAVRDAHWFHSSGSTYAWLLIWNRERAAEFVET